ncbi:PREDICTED: poly(U)-specific endoribonuclease homolog [Rhagoletis zephyria]|uniref:poly(U)-specific endoribonuclease homolog n=1 Tax=Rhagoletis zephyria TaxID=28612 RepID=UPI0008114F36|nr:PREDICTED: poly(U)-specific endoribonuclease homolog [Rhagoletis zephyria]
MLIIFLLLKKNYFPASYKTEIEITPAPPEEQTTKKSGWFSRLFGSGGDKTSTTTTPLPPRNVPPPTQTISAQPQPQPNTPRVQPNAAGAQRPPPLAINPQAPLMPLGPRPDTPPSSPLAGNAQQPPRWPQPTQQSGAQVPTTPVAVRPQAGGAQQQTQTQQQRPQVGPTASHFGNVNAFGAGSNTNTFGRPGAAQPNLPPGFAPYQPPKAQPSGLDLSYGGGARPQGGNAGRPGFGLAPLTSTTTTTSTSTTTTPKPGTPGSSLGLDVRNGFSGSGASSTTHRPATPKDDFPPLPPPRRPSGGAKEDFPPLPTPRTPGSPTPASPLRPSSPGGAAQPAPPFAWGSPTPAAPSRPGSSSISPGAPTPTSPTKPSAPAGGPTGVSFVPHVPGPSTTARPGSANGNAATGSSLASDDEIRALTEQLYAKEQSLLNYVNVNPQGKTRSIDSTDEAPKPLFEVEPRAFETPTVAKMRALFDNYEEDTLANEHVTVNERREENEFVDAVMGTQVMRQAMLFLQNKGIVTPDPKTHRDLVKELWFTQYSRGQGRIGSSGFEHVFVHEVKNGTLIGLHNWVYFADEEKAGRLDYKGYLNQVDLGNKGKVLKVRFTHNGVTKPVNGVFAGTSPELELALYTVCFQLRPDRSCPVSLGNQRLGIVTYTWRYRGKHLIGSAFPEI